MRVLPPPITSETFENQVSGWLKALELGESVCVMFCPRTDRQWRFNQLLDDRLILKKYFPAPAGLRFAAIDLDAFSLEDATDLELFIARELDEPSYSGLLRKLKKNRQKLALVFRNAEKLFEPQCRLLIGAVAGLIEASAEVTLLAFFEADLFLPQNLALFRSRTSLLENVRYWPLYQEADVRQFLAYLEAKWSLKLPAKAVAEIIARCGGHFLLIKEAVRYYRDHPRAGPAAILDHEEMGERLAWVVAGFGTDEQEILRRISRGVALPSRFRESFRYLEKLGLIKNRRLTVPLLADYLRAQNEALPLEINEGRVFYRQISLTGVLSRQEHRALKKLVENMAKVVSRDQIATVIWQEKAGECYSDWAIDQLMKRLRVKLAELGVSPILIKTVRGLGYRLGGSDAG